MLDTTTAAVNSALQRARARLDQVALEREQLSEPTDPHARALLNQYIAGFEHADTAALERALRTDAAIELVGTRTWFSGRVTCLRYLTQVIGSPGDWRMVPTVANRQPAAAAYHRDSDGIHRAFGLGVLTVTHTGIARASSSSAAAPTWSPSSASHPSTRARKLRRPPSAEPGGRTPPRRRGRSDPAARSRAPGHRSEPGVERAQLAWRNPSRPPRDCAAWTSTRSADGAAGTAGCPWPCWPTRSGGGRGHPARPPPTTVGADPVDLQRDPAPVRRPGLPACQRPPAPVALVVVATPAPGPRSCLPLPAASRQ
jgi:hypothetical protein